jgi:Arc/MetJ family transcription regulator
MRTTLNLDEKLYQDASRLTGIKEKTAVIHKGLEALIAQGHARRLAALGGTQKELKAPRRRRAIKE